MTNALFGKLKFDDRGLIPAIVQDAISGRVLMLGWMNAESLHKTHETGDVWFYSRSRNELWHKGATSGNVLKVRELRLDCDEDALLVRAEPAGPTCHTGSESCFYRELNQTDSSSISHAGFLDELENIVQSRRASTPDESYTARLFAKGKLKIAQKVGEEGLETALAGVAQDDDRLIDESADLLFHLLVLLNERNIKLRDVMVRLKTRHDAK
jgi:phosphoribosyl-ATP pyrophosphohydrolase/phosphoribosyl-AMP cyclohydrolase